MAVEDTLEVKIKTDADKASSSLDNLAKKIGEVASKLQSAASVSLSGFSKSMNEIASASKSVKTSDFTKIANSLKKFEDIDSAKISRLGSGVKNLSKGIISLSSTPQLGKQMNSTINAIRRLSLIDYSKLNSINFSNFSSQINTLVSSLNSAGTVDKSVSGLINSIARLANAGSGISKVSTELPSLSSGLKGLVTSLSGLSGINKETTGFIAAISKLASAGNNIKKSASGLDDLADALEKFIKRAQNFPAINHDLISLIDALGKLGKASITVNTRVSSMSNGLGKLPSFFNRASKSAKNFNGNIGSAIGMFTKFYIGIRSLIGSLRGLSQSFEAASDYIEAFNYFNVSVSKIAEESKGDYKKYAYDNAKTYADSFQERLTALTSKMTGFNIDKNGELTASGMKNLGMNVTELTQYEAQIAQMTNSVGMLGEASITSSKAMAMLAGDVSSLTNMPVEQVMANFASGMSGMTAAVRKYGIDITQSTLQELASTLGIQKKVSAMTQAEKMYLREIAIVQQSKVAWGDLANTINQPANQIRMLQANIQGVSAMIGRLMIPVISAVLPYLNAMAMALKDLLQYIGDLAGIKWADSSASIASPDIDTSGWDDMEDSVDGVTDSIDKAEKAQKKFNKQLQGFDKLNNLTTTKKDGKKGSGDGADIGGDVSGLLNDALIRSIADYEKEWNKAFSKMTSKADELKKKIEDLFKTAWETGNGFEIGATIANGLNKAIKAVNDGIPELAEKMNKIATILGTALNGFVDTFDWAGFGLAIGRLLRTSLESAQTFIETVNWNNIGQSLSTSLDSFIASGVIEQAFSTLGSSIRAGIQLAFGFVTTFDWPALGRSVGNGINLFFEKMFEVDDETGLNGFQELGTTISDGIRGFATSITSAIQKLNPDDIGKAISDFLSGIDFAGIAQDLSKLATTLLTYLKEAVEGVNWEEIGEDIGIFIQNIDWKGIFSDMSGLALALITGIAKSIKGFASKSPIGAAVAGLFAAPKVISAISMITTMITNIIAIVSSVVSGITSAIGIILSPIGAIVAAVALVGVTLADLWKTSETFRNSVVEAFTKVKDAVVTTFAEKVIPTVKEVASSIAGFVSSVVDFYENSPLKAIVALFASLVATIGGNILSNAITAIGTAFKGLGKFVSGVIDELSGILDVFTGIFSLDFNKIGKGFKKIGSGIAKAFSGIGTLIFGVGADLITGMLKGMLSELKTIGSWLVEHVFTPIVNNVKKLFGIHSPSTVFAELGGYMIDGLKEGLSGIWESIKGIFTGLWNNLKSWWEKNVKLPEIKLPSAEDVKKKIGEIKDKWEGWKASGKELIADAKEKSAGALDKIKTSWGDLKAGTKELVADAKEKTEGKLADLKSKWESLTGQAKELIVSAKEKKDATIDKIKDAWDKWKPDGKTLETKVASIKDKISSAWSSAKEWWSQHVKLPQIKFPEILKTTVKKWLKPIVEVANTIIEKINKLLHIEWKDVKFAGKTLIKGGSFTITKIPKIPDNFATGGYPKSQELFYANENGKAELIGRQGNRATVVNNDQIIKSVSAGVSDAVFNSMNPVLTHLVASINKMNNSQKGTPLYVEGVSEGDIVRITTDANRDYKNRTGRTLYA